MNRGTLLVEMKIVHQNGGNNQPKVKFSGIN